MAFVERDGVKIYFEDTGEGPAVLLSHGYSATSQMWAAQVEALKSEYRVVTWDMRGHGRTDTLDRGPLPPRASVPDLDRCVDRARSQLERVRGPGDRSHRLLVRSPQELHLPPVHGHDAENIVHRAHRKAFTIW